MSKNNLDELFRKQFRDFDEVPDEKVWSAIEASLEKKKSRKIIPIWWWQLGGIAAALIFLLYLVSPFSKDAESDPSITDVEHSATTNSMEIIEQSKNQKGAGSSTVTTEKGMEDAAAKQNSPNSTVAYIVGEDEHERSSSSTIGTNNAIKEKSPSFAVTPTMLAKNEKVIKSKSLNNVPSTKTTTNTPETSFGSKTKNLEDIANLPLDEKNKLRRNKDASNNLLQSNGEATPVADNLEKKPVTKKNLKKKSIFDEIEDEEVVVAENSVNKWSVSPSVAPVYFNAIGEGSPIHSAFVSNAKTGNVNLSYGVAVAYEVSKKLKVRTGIHKVDYGYSTNQIEFSSSVNGASTVQITNIDFKQSSKNIVVQSELSSDTKPQSIANDVSAKSPKLNGDISQQFGYLEVPLELNYALLDKRFGINVIGGVSSLFLLNNDVFLNSGDQTTEVGEANNINNLNFSTNFGFGFNYKLTQKLLFNVEPVFKYQLNTFSNTAGEFQPFSIGVYSGVSFRF